MLWKVPAASPHWRRAPWRCWRSTSQAEAFDDGLVLLRRAGFEVVEELAALVHHLEQAAARCMVALVVGEVLTQTIDALREERDLNFGRSRILGRAAILRQYPAFLLAGQWHWTIFLK